VQRITRYPLLIRQILSHTPQDPESEFIAVQRSLEEVENITGAVNESVRAAEGDERLRVLSEDLWIGGEGWVPFCYLALAIPIPAHTYHVIFFSNWLLFLSYSFFRSLSLEMSCPLELGRVRVIEIGVRTRRRDGHGLMNSRLDLTAPTAYQGPRTLLKEGTVTKSKSGRKLTMVLCNDIIVLVESRNLYRMVCSFLP